MAQYFKNVYSKTVTDVKQPLFVSKIADQMHYLPPEFCLVDGVSDSMRKSPGMREALKRTHITPQDKVSRIQRMADILQAQKALKQWDLKIEAVPVEIKSRVMDAPKIFKNNQVIYCDENILRKLPIQKAVDLKHERWIMVYQHNKRRSNFEIADHIYNDFVKASKQLQIVVEEPYWIELDDENDKEELKHKLREYMIDSKGIFRHPLICVAVLGFESNYPAFKEVFQQY